MGVMGKKAGFLTIEEFNAIPGAYLGPVVLSCEILAECRPVLKMVNGHVHKLGLLPWFELDRQELIF